MLRLLAPRPCMTTNRNGYACATQAVLEARTPPCSLLVEGLDLVVEGRALLDGAEALDAERLPGGVAGGDPRGLLALQRHLLAHDLAGLVLDQVGLGRAARGLGDLAR